jgi:hypothetical protein
LILAISSFSFILSSLCSLTFNIFPLRGKTPYCSRPIIDNPLIANALAESPSVKINVHSVHLLVPANVASSNLGIFNPCLLADLSCLANNNPSF